MTYRPRRQSQRWLKGAPDAVLCVMDNKGTSADRYTVIFGDPYTFHVDRSTGNIGEGADTYANTWLYYLGMSDAPSHPQGVGMTGQFDAYDCAQYRYRFKHQYATWESLPDAVKRCVIDWIREDSPDILYCGHVATPGFKSISLTGYGIDAQGNRHCYDCCAANERKRMIETGKATMYMVERDGRQVVTDWPGKLTFPTSRPIRGRHNMARFRYDVDFNGPDGHIWHAVRYGDNTRIAHCRRTRAKWSATA